MGIGEKGTTLIDVVISLGIMVFLFGGIYLVYFSLVDSTSNIDAKNAAAAAINQQVETVRNLPYDSVGVVGGIPAGVIPASRNVLVGNFNFTIYATVRNIDDPFDGTLGGVPNDTAPADYKLVEFRADCQTCVHFSPMTLTMTASPKSLESLGQNGSLFVNVFNASAQTVSGAAVHVINSSTTPTIDLTDTTNANGQLQLVGVPTSTQNYRIIVSKSGYSTERTYHIGDISNPNPLKQDATVSASQLTSISFAIDKVSSIKVYSADARCAAVPNQNFSVQGSKLIGTNPDVFKFSTSSQTDAYGSSTLPNIEWDSYGFSYGSSNYLRGTIPLDPLAVSPGSTSSFSYILSPSAPNGLLATITDAATGAPISGATVNLSKIGYSSALITGRDSFSETDWSNNNYSSQSGGADAGGLPGSLRLLVNASGTYNPPGSAWLISNTIDVGSSTANYFSFSSNPVVQSLNTNLQFQFAANNDNSAWNFIGPDGTANTFYGTSSTLSGLDGNRYLRYKVFLSTSDGSSTPRLDDISLSYYSVCVPAGQVLFTGLSQASYQIDVSAPGYFNSSSSVNISPGWQSKTVQLTHQ